MTMARRPSPFGELLSLRQAMDRLFEDSYVRSRGVPYGSVEALALPLDIYSTPGAIVVEAALPGVKPEDVEITVLGNTLTISGTSFEQRGSEEPDFMYQELRRGTFARTVALPSNLDTHDSTATFEHGMLRLSIPKAAEAKARQIRITPTHDSSATESAAAGYQDGVQADAGDTATAEDPGNDSRATSTAGVGGPGEAGSSGSDEGGGAAADRGHGGEASWEPAAGSDAWNDPAATQATGEWQQPAEGADSWSQPAQAAADSWGQQAAASPTDTWSDPSAAPATEAWAEPAPTSGDSWSGQQPSADTWGQSPAADHTWGQPAAADADGWGAGTGAQDPYATTTDNAQEWQTADAEAGSWQAPGGRSDRQRAGDQARG